MLKLMDKKKIQFYAQKLCLSKPEFINFCFVSGGSWAERNARREGQSGKKVIILYRGSYTSAYVLFDLLNELGKIYKMRC